MTFMAFLAPKFLLLYAFIATGTYVHFRGKVRHKFSRQLLDHSTIMAPYNCFAYASSAVPNTPFVELEHFPELKLLEDNWETIRDEAAALFDEGRIRTASGHTDLAFHSFFKSGWKRFYLKWYGDMMPSAEQLCPKTVALVNQIPSLNAAMFAMLPAGGRLTAHRDPFAGSLRYHLGLITPNDDQCFITVDGEDYSWRDGKGVIFDETFIHSAHNKTEHNRIILFCDVERPMKWKLAQGVNRFFKKIAVAASASTNDESESLGVLNKLFSYVYLARLQTKKLKKSNRTLYYFLKWLLLGTVAYFIFLHGMNVAGKAS